MFDDQFGNARWAGEKGAGLKLPGTNVLFTQILPAKEITAAIKTVANFEGKRESFSKNALKMQKMVKVAALPGGSSNVALNNLLNFDSYKR